MSDEQPPALPPIPASVEVNPYAPPTTDPRLQDSLIPDPEALRRPNLAHEASIKGIGALILIGGLLIVASAVSSLAVSLEVEEFIVPIILVMIGMGQILAGWCLYKFGQGARILCSVLCGFMLIIIPLGTLMGAYFLYVLLGSKGSLIFTERYQEAMRQTPHLKYRTPTWNWILLGLLFLIGAGLCIYVVMTS